MLHSGKLRPYKCTTWMKKFSADKHDSLFQKKRFLRHCQLVNNRDNEIKQTLYQPRIWADVVKMAPRHST
jgi:hypothetical protein